MNLSDKILDFLISVDFKGKLPTAIKLLNPYQNNPTIIKICKEFYTKYYSDEKPRKLILGINPGRLGAGSTGLPFTDTKRLNDICEIPYNDHYSHEPSSDFIYKVIAAYGGPKRFYEDFYFSSVCPLGFIKVNHNNSKPVNYNYYDDKELYLCVERFIINNLYLQKSIAQSGDQVFCLGTGKNFKFLESINNSLNIYDKIVPVEHPRYIMQYKAKLINNYIDEYLVKLNQ